MNINPLIQPDDTACGPTCIQMATDYFGMNLSFKEIAKISQYKKKDGLSNPDLVETFEKLGLKATQKSNCKWSDLRRFLKSNKVVIVSWMKKGYLGHFSVVKDLGRDYIEIIDPEEGVVKMEKIIFLRLWLDYDDMWYPEKNTDIQLRWLCAVSPKNKIMRI